MLAGKKCLITGATSGIGKATAKLFAKEGAQVLATGRNAEALRALKEEINCLTFQADLEVEGQAEAVVKEAAAKLDGLTTVVNCAGILQGGAFGSDACNLEQYNKIFNANTRSVFEVMVQCIPHLKAAGTAAGPAIINISSVNGKQSFGGVATYCASKAAVDMFTRCAAVDLAPFGIRVNAVNPGVIATELHRRGGMSEETYQGFIDRSISTCHPIAQALGRVGKPEEVANLIAFLASDKALFLTGECISIDGGRGCLGAR